MNMMKRELVCILCPRGCALTADITPDGVTVTGNACPRGAQYAVDECTHPVRTVTSIIRVENRPGTMVSVKTAVPIPKEKMSAVMARIRAATVAAPIRIGDVLLTDICGTTVIATKAID